MARPHYQAALQDADKDLGVHSGHQPKQESLKKSWDFKKQAGEKNLDARVRNVKTLRCLAIVL